MNTQNALIEVGSHEDCLLDSLKRARAAKRKALREYKKAKDRGVLGFCPTLEPALKDAIWKEFEAKDDLKRWRATIG